jgi:hypothetical protein
MPLGVDTMMQNGNRILMVRITISGLLCAMVIGLAGWLIHAGYEIPAPWWVLGGLAIGGVVGADVITTYFAKGGGVK